MIIEPLKPTLSQSAFSESAVEIEENESYFDLVWRRFRRSPVSIIGALMVLMLVILAIFADFFSPTSISGIDLQASFIPPQQVHFFDTEGKFHLRPFVYNYVYTLDPTTFRVKWAEDQTKAYEIKFLVQGPAYKLFGLIPSKLHLYGVEEGGTIFILGTDKIGRDLWGKTCEAGRISLSMSLFGTIISVLFGSVLGVASGYYGGWIDNVLQRFTEFVAAFPNLPLWMALAAKEMGASDARIIFLHLYPNTLSHIIVILTLTIPGVILAESFLSFLGIGITEPLISWGLLMRNTQDIQTLGQNAWILSPIVFIVTAVLGFNFLGDGLRDAADPYASR